MGKVMAIVEGEAVVDYAYPCMMAERALKQLHEFMLEGKYDQAVDAANVALTETRLTLTAVRAMREARDARERGER